MKIKSENRRALPRFFLTIAGAGLFGGVLGFAAGFAPEIMGAMIAGKLAGGVSAIAVALWLTRKEEG